MTNAKALFFTPYGSYRVHNQVDAVIAASLRLRGAETLMVTCDGLFQSCEVTTWSKDQEKDCAYCAGASLNIYNALGLQTVQLRAALQPDDRQRVTQWVDSLSPDNYSTAVFEHPTYGKLEIGRWCTSSVFSYFRITAAQLSRADVRALHRKYLANSLVTYLATARICDQFQPTHGFVFNCRMAPFRTAYELLRSRNVPVTGHERGVADDTFVFSSNFRIDQSATVVESHAPWRDTALTEDQLLSVRGYLMNRENGKDMNLPSFFDFKSEAREVRHKLRIPSAASVVGVFTSTEFEQAYNEDFKSITGQMALIDQLIELFRNRSEYLVIRHHPYIAGSGLSPPDLALLTRIHEQAANVPQNVRVIMPSERLSSYALFPILAGAIAPFSTVSLETASRGIPTACYPENHFKVAVTHQIDGTDRAALSGLVESLLEHSKRPSVEDLRRVYRFLNFYTTKFSVKFKAFGIKNFYEDDIRARHSSELLPGNDSSLDRLCDHVLKGTSVFPVPSHEDQSRTMEMEDRFLGIQLQEIQGFRRYLAREADTVARSATEHKIAAIVNEKFNPLGSRGDLKRQRITGAVKEYGWSSESGDFESQRAALRAVISNVTEEFVFLPWDRFTYQESVLSSALELLTGPEKRNAVGFGVWVRDENGRIDHQIFGKEDPPVSFKTVQEAAVEHPLALLGLIVFRKTALLKVLEQPAFSVREALAALPVHETRVTLVINSQGSVERKTAREKYSR